MHSDGPHGPGGPGSPPHPASSVGPEPGQGHRGPVVRSAVRHAPLVTQVSEQFRELVRSGQWPVGQKIPGEHELAGQLGVSRATVREALRGLSITGLLEARIGDGTYVRATNEITGVLLRDEPPSLLEHVLDARAGIEAACARLAARQATPIALEVLWQRLDARTRAHGSGDVAAYARADSAFHEAVVHASGNPLLVRLYAAVAEVMEESVRHTSVLPEAPRTRDAHRQLAVAISAGDEDAAGKAAYELIASVKAAAPLAGPATGARRV